MLTALGKRAIAWAHSAEPWTDAVGCVRSILALCTAATLAFNSSLLLFAQSTLVDDPEACSGVRGMGLFCLATGAHLETARWLAVIALVVVASGWRPRITGVLHWWIAFSFQANAAILDGGDQVAAILTLVLIPCTLTDPRRWHWDAPPRVLGTTSDATRRFIARSALAVARLQVACIYFHAAVGKMVVPEWADGTVLYYWFTDPFLGAPPWLMPVVRWIVDHGALLTLLTWSVLAIEFLLATAIVMHRRYRPMLLVCGVALHAGILVIHGLFTFAVTMMAALLLYLSPPDGSLGFAGRLVGRVRGVSTSWGSSRRLRVATARSGSHFRQDHRGPGFLRGRQGG